jgi:hypothetical protein
MSKDLTTPKPQDFGLASFSDLLSSRPPIPGEQPGGFDALRAERVAELADCILSNDPLSQADAHHALTELGVPLLNMMGSAYAETHDPASRHDAKVQELERRRREVMRDYAALQRARPIDHAQTDADTEDAEIVQP